MSNQKIYKKRLIIIYILFLVIFFILIGKILFLSFSKNKSENHLRLKSSHLRDRGNIYDRNGVILATDIQTKTLYLRKSLIKDPKLAAKKLANIFPKNNIKFIFNKAFTKNNNQEWFLIKRNIIPSQENLINNLHIAGLVLKKDISRIYPYNLILSHILGYTNVDRRGISGVELQYDEILSKNQNINLAIDIKIQSLFFSELNKSFKKYDAIGAAGIIMDVHSGEIISAISLPSFKLNNIDEAKNNRKFNRVTYGVYEMGSILKIITNAIVFEEGLITQKDEFDVSEPIKYGKFNINDYHKIHKKVNIEEIFTKSSNIGTVKIAKLMTPQMQKKYFEELNLITKVNLDFPSLGHPIIPKKWSDISLYTISYGHGIALSPVHISSAISAIVNGGNFKNPSLLKLNHINEGKRIFKKSTSDIINKFMKNAILNGTGRNAATKFIDIGGKTGTAEKAEKGGYSKDKTLTSFVATIPADNPKYVILILMDEPKAEFRTGGYVVAPIIKSLVEKIYMILF